MVATLVAPFPWFGGKSRVAAEVWARFGDVKNYVEPFFGSGAVLLGRPAVGDVETINDLDGYVANFWRALKHEPDATADWASDPINENDLTARHVWLLQQRETLAARLNGIWIWEGRTFWVPGPYGAENEGEMETRGAWREPTDEEWTAIMQRRCPWNDEDWKLPVKDLRR